MRCSCLSRIFWSLVRCPRHCGLWPTRTRSSSTTCSFRALLPPCRPWPWPPNTSGGQLGMVGVLHTWTRELAYRPHIHYLVPGGALALDGSQWLSLHSTEWLVSVHARALQTLPGQVQGGADHHRPPRPHPTPGLDKRMDYPLSTGRPRRRPDPAGNAGGNSSSWDVYRLPKKHRRNDSEV